jgi:UDP-N-acetylenolpyruvoylglucosamine reductase
MMNTANKQAFLEKTLPDIRIVADGQIQIGHQELETELYIEAATPEELIRVVSAARSGEIPYHILGLGFNPHEADKKIAGLVIKNNCRKFDMLSMKGKVSEEGQTETEFIFVMAETGVGLNQIVRYTLDEGLSGLEYFLGIGGTLGDNLMQNVRDEKHEDYLASHIFTIRFLSKENEEVEVSAEPFLYPLETNILAKKQALPLSVVFKVKPADKTALWKQGTQAAFERNQSELLDPLKGNFNY